jgi:oxygen-independent coproporphyrinogen-3 oxidase
MRGLDLVDYRKRFGADLRDKYSTEVARLSEAGLIEIDQDLMRLTRRGALLSNEVFAALA